VKRLIYLFVPSIAITLIALLQWQHRISMRYQLADYRTESADETTETARRVEARLSEIYRSLRTIARLPGVVSIDWNETSATMDHGGNVLDGNTRLTVQEIYNSLVSDVAVSELYVVPLNLDPDGIDPTQMSPPEPVTSFDEFIVGRIGAPSTLGGDEAEEIEEIEIFEYRMMRTQLDWMAANSPNTQHIVGLEYPLVGGPPVITCDNSRFIPDAPDDADRSGVVLSVPIYDQGGVLRGSVSAVILTHALSDLLISGDYAILNTAYQFAVPSHVKGQWHRSQAAGVGLRRDDELLYSQVVPIATADRGGAWTLWAGHSNDKFWARSGVRAGIEARNLGFVAILVLALGAAGGIFLVFRVQGRLATANAELEATVAKRTEALLNSRDATANVLKRERIAAAELTNQKNALDKHAIVSITDVRGIITYANDRFCEVSGYAREEIIGQYHRLVKSDEHSKSFYREMWETISSGRVWSGEIKNRAKDGSHYWLEATIVPFKDEFGSVTQYVAIRTDITELKAIAEELRQARSAAEMANLSKSAFLANMSHEIRTPMTAILGFAETIAETVQDPQVTESIAIIQRNGEHLLSVINDILDLSKVEAGKMTIERVGCNLVGLVDEVVSLMKDRAICKGLTFEIDYSNELPETIQTDPTRLRQVLINLIGNAIKFTESGSVRIIPRFVDGDTPQIEIDVVDTGIGLSQDQIEVLFQPFTQADDSTTREFGGTGLGLTISKRFAELLGGDIRVVASAPGKGTHFRVTVETGSVQGVELVRQSTSPKAAAHDPQTRIMHTDLDGYRILLAEDGPDNQRLICFVLKKAGADVTVMKNGKLALDAALAARANGNAYDCILMDMQMPVMSGYESATRLREAGYTQPIIALTAHSMKGDREKCLEAGCNDYCTKPIDRPKLIDTIASHIRRSSAAA
jgi:PAS domain S-box-containing protein